jgi:hypothetical protein
MGDGNDSSDRWVDRLRKYMTVISPVVRIAVQVIEIINDLRSGGPGRPVI